MECLRTSNQQVVNIPHTLQCAVLCPLYSYRQSHPLNFIFLGLFTLCLSISVGIACANTKGRIMLEALILTSIVVSTLTGYTFWAAKKGKDFSYLTPVLFAGLTVLILTSFIQVGNLQYILIILLLVFDELLYSCHCSLYHFSSAQLHF
ncbi:BI1-like protein [Magnolia sinica]|uniref:BI1-like protein n=1 Tax=Magnolia sinica TaxID=86752 RepID=UPI00265AA1DA|nr:BI1-like protein [Magnolia sinica]